MNFKEKIDALEQAHNEVCSRKLELSDYLDCVSRRLGVLYTVLYSMYDEAEYSPMERGDYCEQLVLMSCEELFRIREEMLSLFASHSNLNS
ncbi:MAG: hypothetical protein ACI4J3_07850 [Oscillospiraceae bacterium]